MASATITSASMQQNAANTVIDAEVEIHFGQFDINTGLTWRVELSVVGDDSTDFSDDGFDPQPTGLPSPIRVRYNGVDTITRSFHSEVATVELAEDPWWNNTNLDAEVALKATLTPELPHEKTAESQVFTIANNLIP